MIDEVKVYEKIKIKGYFYMALPVAVGNKMADLRHLQIW